MKKIFGIISVVIFAIFFSTVFVISADAKNSLSTTKGKTNASENRALAATTASNQGKAIAAGKLADAKLKVCQNKETSILKRNTQLTKMAENMLTKFDSIANKVKTYYTDKIIPSGKTVPNYNNLVAEITTKKQIVQTDLDKANSDASAFKCTGDDPKGQLTQLRIDMQTVKQDLKDYRTSIKNLIVAIRSVTGTAESSSTD